MEIVNLPIGERAPADSDCLSIDIAGDGSYLLTGSILVDGESQAIVGGETYPSHQAASEAGIAWASAHAVAVLHISTNGEPAAGD